MAVAGMARIKRQNRVRDNVDSIVHSIGTLHAELSVGSSARTVGTGLKVRTLVSRTKARGDGADTPVAIWRLEWVRRNNYCYKKVIGCS